MTDPIQAYFDRKFPILSAVNSILSAWTEKGCYPVPRLLEQLKMQFNWSEKQERENDPVIRDYFREHAVWYITRGAHGGIGRVEDRNVKLAFSVAKQRAKEEINAILDAEVVRKNAEANKF